MVPFSDDWHHRSKLIYITQTLKFRYSPTCLSNCTILPLKSSTNYASLIAHEYAYYNKYLNTAEKLCIHNLR